MNLEENLAQERKSIYNQAIVWVTICTSSLFHSLSLSQTVIQTQNALDKAVWTHCSDNEGVTL